MKYCVLLIEALSLVVPVLAQGEQIILDNAPGSHQQGQSPWLSQPELSETALRQILKKHEDPVEAFKEVHPEHAASLMEPRLLHLRNETRPRWMTEGDKMRLRRSHTKFIDVTEHHENYARQIDAMSGKAHTPDLRHQRMVRPLFSEISTSRMQHVLVELTSFYNRYYGGVPGERSALWLHDHIAEIIQDAPFHTHISLEFFTHPFPQSSIIARFEPKVRNSSLPLTILGAHQDSANYLFPLLPAPGADDDGSGTTSILEAFRVLANSGYVPKDGPVEFHWYAAEEGGLLGSQRIARDKREAGAKIGAMLEFDMTAYVARNATESIGLIATEADDALTDWLVKLGEEYISIPTKVYDLGPLAGSDYMSFTLQKYPAAFASEGDPLANGGFPGDYDPYVHTANDTLTVDDEYGYFSFDHMARFSELAIAFVVEQAGWDNAWR